MEKKVVLLRLSGYSVRSFSLTSLSQHPANVALTPLGRNKVSNLQANPDAFAFDNSGR
jgi:hypothetical protein